MVWENEIASIENYYANLIIIQYRNKPKARATIKLGVDLYLADGLVFDLQNVLDIDTAQGKQLDLIGKILGCNRNVFGFTLNKKYFTFEKVNAYGFSDVNYLSEGLWKKYANSTASAFALDDSDYRLLLKFKAIYNLRRGSWGSMDELYYRAFGDSIEMINNQNATISYYVSHNVALVFQIADYLGYIKPPLGIGYDLQNTVIFKTPVHISSYLTGVCGLAFGNNMFCAVTETGYVSVSQDGANWTTPQRLITLSAEQISCLTFNNNKFFALTNKGNIYSAIDGLDFEQVVGGITPVNNVNWLTIGYGNNKLIAIGEDLQDMDIYISTSSDGSTWDIPIINNVFASTPVSIAYGSGKYVALESDGTICVSNDANTWQNKGEKLPHIVNEHWQDLTYDGYKFVAISENGYISESSDGETWQDAVKNYDLGENDWYRITYGNNKYVVSSFDHYISYSIS